MDLSEAMRSTPAIREFTGRELPDSTLYRILDDARFAPNGGNRQAWRVVVIRDPSVKREIARLYDLGFREYAAHLAAGVVPTRDGSRPSISRRPGTRLYRRRSRTWRRLRFCWPYC
jgi:nitroreductase